MKKDPIVFLEHILECIANIESFMRDVSKEYLFSNVEKQSAVIRQIEIIGEAAKNIPPSFTQKYPTIPWKEMAGMRDKLMHHYFGIDLNTVWKVIKEDLPYLKKEIKNIKKKDIP